MDPGARWSLIIGAVAGLLVAAAAALVAPAAPAIAIAAGLLSGWLYVRTTRRELPTRVGQGGIIALPPILLGQGAGTAVHLLLLGGGLELGSRVSMLGRGGGPVELPVTMVIGLIAFVVLLDLALVLLAAEWIARRVVKARAEMSGWSDTSEPA
jgi:hypothetical protein